MLLARRVLIASLLVCTAAFGSVEPPKEEYDDCAAGFIAYVGTNAFQFSPLLKDELGMVRLYSILSYQGVTVDKDFGRAFWKLEIRGPEEDDRLILAKAGVARIDERGATLVEYFWDGKDQYGNFVEHGTYHYTFKSRFIPDRHAANQVATEYDAVPVTPRFAEAQASTRDVIVNYALDVRASKDLRESLLLTSCQTQQNAPMQAAFGYNFYYGSTHSHSNFSDGGMDPATCGSGKYGTTPGFTPTDVFAYVKANSGLDYWVVNEHNHLIDDALTKRGLAKNETNAKQSYQDGLAAANAATVNGSFVGLYGMEWGVISGGGHVTVLDTPKLFGWESCTTCTGGSPECTPGTDCYFDVYTPKSNYPSLYAASVANPSSAGPLGIFCHPNSSDFGSYAFNANADAAIQGVAVRSGLAFATTATCGDTNVGATDYSSQWRKALNIGFHVGPIADHDGHCNVYGVSNPIRTVYLIPNGASPALTKANLIQAHKARHFFASEDSNAQLVFETLDGSHIMGDIFSTGTSITLHGAVYDPNGEGVQTLQLWRGQIGAGALTSPYVTFPANSTSFTQVESISSGTYYYFVRAVQTDGHDIWSAPMWITFGTVSCTDSDTPTVSISAPANGASVSGNVTIQVAAADGTCGISSVQIQINGGTWTNAAFNAGTGDYEYAWDSNASTCSGPASINARATDLSTPSHVGTAASVNVTVVNPDTTPPSASISAPASGATISCSNTLVQVTSADAGGISSVQVKIDGGAWNSAAFNAGSGKYEYTWNSAAATSGSHTIDARAIDASCAANTTNATPVSVTVNNASCAVNPAAVLTATATGSQNLLNWVNPETGGFAGMMIRFRTDGVFPTGPADGTQAVDKSGSLGAKDSFLHSGLVNGTTYSYAAFAHDSVPSFATSLTTVGRPQVVTGATKWVYNTGATALAPPGGSIYFVSNDRVLHSAVSGASGGGWPTNWKPFAMNAPSQSRPRVVPASIGGATRVAFISSQDGHVYCVDADTGALVWSSALLGDAIQAGVSGTLTQLGFSYDALMVGSRNSSGGNSFFGLDPIDGTTVWTFDNGGGANGIGIISGAAAVDASTSRVYFGSRALAGGSSGTLWCLTFSDTTSSLCNASWPLSLGDIDGSPVLAGGRLYVGTNGGTVYSLDPTTGGTIWGVSLGDGSIKDYIWPQFGANYFYVSTGSKVWSLSDSGTSTPTTNWSFSIAGPSTPYYDAGTGRLFVGSTDGKLHQLSSLQLATPVDLTAVIGAGTSVVGSPAMDASGLLDVGTDSGAVYSVAIPLSSCTTPSGAEVVISEFRTRGSGGAADEFVELYNRTCDPVSISNWKISGSNNAGFTSTRATVPAGTVINPGCHYLVANTSYNDAVAANLTYGTGITDDGGIALLRADNSIADQVGMSAGSAYKEGTILTPLTASFDRSYGRLPGGSSGHAIDSNNNSSDFFLLDPSQPENAVSGCH